MDPLVYKLIHIIGITLLFLSFGAMLGGGSGKSYKMAAMGHGIALLLILVSGFGMQAKYGYPLGSGWLITKIAIWAVFGAVIVFAKRRAFPLPGLVALLLIAGGAAAWLGLMKPF